MAIKIIILAALLIIAFVLSAAEVALYTVTSAGDESRPKLFSRVFRSPQILLSTILVSNALAVFLFTLVGASVALDLAAQLSMSRAMALVIEVLIVSGLLIFFADAVPKNVAVTKSNAVLNFSMPLLVVLLVVESPIVYPLNRFLSRITAGRKRRVLTIDSKGLAMLSRIAGSAGVIEENEAELLRKISSLGERNVRDTMTKRNEIVSISENALFDDVVEAFRKSGHSRLPVYSGSTENLSGMIYARDFLPLFRKRAGRRKFTAASLMRNPVFVPETQSLEKLIETFRSNKVHIAVVVDEFGGLSGIVTLSDVVREIFGSSAEMPREGAGIFKLPDGTFLAKGRARLGDLPSEVVSSDFEANAGETISSLLVGVHGSVPRVGSKIMIGNYEFEVIQATPKTILQVKFRKLYSSSTENYG